MLKVKIWSQESQVTSNSDHNLNVRSHYERDKEERSRLYVNKARTLVLLTNNVE